MWAWVHGWKAHTRQAIELWVVDRWAHADHAVAWDHGVACLRGRLLLLLLLLHGQVVEGT